MHATARYVRSSARKARLVCDHIRGKSVPEARAILAFAPRGVAKDWAKLLESAVANAEHNHELVGDELRIKEVYADVGPTLKRFRPRAHGPRDADPQAHQPPLDRAHAEGVTMGQKVHPESMRVGYIHDWQSNWFNERNFAEFLAEDIRSASTSSRRLAHAGLSDITIKKNANEVEVNIRTARPGIVIGKSGSEVDALRKDLHRITRKQIKVNILEIKRPELDAKLVAQSIAEQLQNRVAFRRAMKRALTSAMRSGAKGVKVQVSGRLGGAEMARTEAYSDGRVPLHTMRADIDYGFYEARTTFGRIGVKCWINKGEIMPEGYAGTDLTDMSAPAPASRRRSCRAVRARRARRSQRTRPRRRHRAAAGRADRDAGAAADRAAAGRRWRRRTRARTRGPGGRSLMLAPKRVKHRKQHRGRRAGLSRGQVKVQFGEYGLKSLEAGWLTNRQIEAARIAMTRKIRRGGKVWINVFPDKPVTKKPAETRMGSGKGSPEGWVAVVKPGPRDVRAGRRVGAARARRDAPRRPQAPRQDQVRVAGGLSRDDAPPRTCGTCPTANSPSTSRLTRKRPLRPALPARDRRAREHRRPARRPSASWRGP